MKKLLLLTGIIAGALSITGCGGAHGNDPGDAYMPDMYYSRAYETYGYNNSREDHNPAGKDGSRAHYNGMPVPGTIARGDAYTFPIAAGDSGYAQAAAYRAPGQPTTFTPAQTKEAERLYLINCAICHGSALDGNGPLWKGGDGPYPAAPRNLMDDYTKKLSDAQMYHVITYGKGQMGSYASQVHPEQRWWIINYIRSKQGPAKTDSAAATTATTATPAAATTSAPATGSATPAAGM
ncbi:MAG: c-type cytochrome [Chitinophagaceae bacterium]|nr:MAG: c-type cytochrome [Chitinophagaceae bacterium]